MRSALPRKAIAATALLVATTSTLLIGGCGSDSTPSRTAATPQPDLPPLMVTVCLDRTRSFDRPYFDDAKNLLADAIQQRATAGGQLGATIYVTLIGHNSYASSATVRTIVVPSDSRSDTSATPNTNIFDQSTVTAAARYATATASTATNQVVHQVQPDIAFLRALNPPTDSSTDILGCVSRASERFQTAPHGTQKLLILATDLQEAGSQQSDKSRLLTGVHVKVIEWKCDDAQACDTLKDSWHDEFVTNDQAASVSYYDPGETQAQLASHLFETNP